MIIAGLDVGTTGCKIALYDENAVHQKTYYKEYDAVHKDGQHEINFCDIREGVIGLLKQATADYQVSYIGVTSFGETFAMLDENDNVLSGSMLYTDPRGVDECEELCRALGREKITLITGINPHSMYSMPKIMWHKNNNKEAFSKCKRILLGADYIVYVLSGVAQIDYPLASRTCAFDIEKMCWSKEIFDAAGVDMSLMAKPVPIGTLAGELRDELKAELGIDYSLQVVTGAHDQIAAMIGSGVFESYQAMDGTGTVECIPVIMNEKSSDLELYKGGYAVVPYIDGKYACYALSFTGGATLKWFRDNFAELENKKANENGTNVYATLDGLVPEGPTGLLVLPHFAGAATPYMDTDSKAAFLGVTLETTKYDLYKALMEGTSYEMQLNFNTLKAHIDDITELRATGGGATSDVWLQIKADILGLEIMALSCKEIGAAGTVAITGVTAGVYKNLSDTVSKMATVRKIFKPRAEVKEEYAKLYERYSRLYKAVKSV